MEGRGVRWRTIAREGRAWAGFKTKLALICSLMAVSVLGLMYLAEKQQGAVLLQRARRGGSSTLDAGADRGLGDGGWGLALPLTPRRRMQKQQLLLVEQQWPPGPQSLKSPL